MFPSYLTHMGHALSPGNEAGQVVLTISETIVLRSAYIRKVIEGSGLIVLFILLLKGRQGSLSIRPVRG